MASATAEKKSKKVEKVEKVKPILSNFPKSDAPTSILNTEGKLTTIDVVANGFNDEKHERLTSDDFANESLWLSYRVSELRRRGTAMLAKADQLEKDATNAAKFGDPAQRSKVKKLQKYADAFAALRAELIAQGVDTSALDNITV